MALGGQDQTLTNQFLMDEFFQVLVRCGGAIVQDNKLQFAGSQKSDKRRELVEPSYRDKDPLC